MFIHFKTIAIWINQILALTIILILKHLYQFETHRIGKLLKKNKKSYEH